MRDWRPSPRVQHCPNLDHCVAYKPPEAAEATPSQWRGDTPPLPRSISLPDARFRRGMMRRPLSQSTGLFQLDRPCKAGPPATLWLIPTPVLRYPTVVIAAGIDILVPNRTGRATKHWHLTDSGWSAAGDRSSRCVCSGRLSPAKQPCFAFSPPTCLLPDRPTENHHAWEAWLSPWIEGHFAGSIVSLALSGLSYRGALMQFVLYFIQATRVGSGQCYARVHQRCPFRIRNVPGAQSPTVTSRRSAAANGMLPRPSSVFIADYHLVYSS